MQKILPPKNCPSCSHELEWKKDTLYCINSNCYSRSLKALEHWVKVLKIKGLGPKTLEKLELKTVEDIYLLTEDYLVLKLGSEKISKKIYNEIRKSTLASLDSMLPAFGIPLIGKSAAEKLSKAVQSLDELTPAKAVEAGLGPKAVENLFNWISSRYKQFNNLNFSFKFDSQEVQRETLGVVCITGKLSSFKTKALATQALNRQGYTVKSSITKDVTILINESGKESAKTEKARLSGITIINNLNKLLGD